MAIYTYKSTNYCFGLDYVTCQIWSSLYPICTRETICITLIRDVNSKQNKQKQNSVLHSYPTEAVKALVSVCQFIALIYVLCSGLGLRVHTIKFSPQRSSHSVAVLVWFTCLDLPYVFVHCNPLKTHFNVVFAISHTCK